MVCAALEHSTTSAFEIWSYVAAVVDETGEVATLGGVDDGVVVHAEHVAAADALLLVTLLPHVCDDLRMDHCYTLEHGCPRTFNVLSQTKRDK